MDNAITVTQLNTYIKKIFDAEEFLHNIPVIGEIFGVSFSRNVIYFSLKDENSTLPCVCFYPNFLQQIIEGNKVIVIGSPNYYTKAGKLNFNVINVENVGQGKLYEQFLFLKEKLKNAGYFNSEHKKDIPKNIRRIGVITSKEGAVIQDIKNVVWRRNPLVDIVLFNTKVQGNLAEKEIAHAIEILGQYKNIDVIIVARGGGSLEDLWAYNTEEVANAVYNCPKPIISAVGHETDFTIIDFVSDLRAPTPSAAAELLTKDLSETKNKFFEISFNFVKTITNFIGQKYFEIDQISHNLINAEERKIIFENNFLNNKKIHFINNCNEWINQKFYELGLLETSLKKINPKEILDKGYAKIEQDNKPISTIKNIDINKNLIIILKDGKVESKIIKKGENNED